MSKIRSVVLLAAVVALSAIATAQNQHFTLNGDFGRAYWSIGNGFADIVVSTNEQGKTVSTFFAFDLWYSPTYVVSAYGNVPNDSFSGNLGSGFEFNLDLQTFQGTVYACTYADPSQTPQCDPITLPGVIHVRWQKTNQESSTWKTAYTAKLPGRHVKQSGTENSYSATASGSFLGMNLGTSYGTVGRTHSVNVDIQRDK